MRSDVPAVQLVGREELGDQDRDVDDARTTPETTARRWRFSCHHIIRHWRGDVVALLLRRHAARPHRGRTARSRRNAVEPAWRRVTRRRPRPCKPDARIEHGQRQVGQKHADHGQHRQEHQERAGEIHVLALQRVQQHRAGGRQRQHDRDDRRRPRSICGSRLPISAMNGLSAMRSGYFISSLDRATGPWRGR